MYPCTLEISIALQDSTFVQQVPLVIAADLRPADTARRDLDSGAVEELLKHSSARPQSQSLGSLAFNLAVCPITGSFCRSTVMMTSESSAHVIPKAGDLYVQDLARVAIIGGVCGGRRVE
jgi:hypothetical protein